MKGNEHPRCGCRSCRLAAANQSGQAVHKAVNRAIRRKNKQQLDTVVKGGDADTLDIVIVSTPPIG